MMRKIHRSKREMIGGENLKVIAIILCSLFGTIALLALCGCARWSFIYLIRYRLLKMEVKKNHYEINIKHDILSIVIAVLTLIAVALLLIYGLPIIFDNADFFTDLLNQNTIGITE